MTKHHDCKYCGEVAQWPGVYICDLCGEILKLVLLCPKKVERILEACKETNDG